MQRLRSSFFRPLSAFALCAALVASCGGGGSGGGGGGGGAAPGSSDFLVSDAPVDELLSFSVTISELRLVDSLGVASANVLLGETSIDLIGAGVAPRWVTRGDLPEGTFSAVRMAFVPGSASAISRGGAPVAIHMLASTFDAPFPAPATIDSSSYRQITIDVDLASSLSGDVGAPPLDFDPQGLAGIATGAGASAAIDEIKGTLQSIDAANDRFVLESFADGDAQVPLGAVTVAVLPATVLLDHDGLAFANASAFWSSLVAGTTVLEIHGNLVAGLVNATRIEVEDAGGGDSYVVRIDGRVTNLDRNADSFDLVLVEVEKGGSVAGPVLNGLGNPASIEVLYDPSTVFLLEDHQPTDENSLSDGQRVKVKFATFVNTPFSALRIEIDDQPEFEGVIVDDSGLPGSVVIHLDDDEPGIDDGQVASSNTPVTVDLSASTLRLDTHAKPALTSDQLQNGLKIEVHGAISGPSNAPSIAATRTKVHSGRFRGHMASASAQLGTFNATMSDLKDSFGDSVTLGNVTVVLDGACAFRDDVASASELFALFAGLGAGESVRVEVSGVGTTTPNEVRAYEIKAKLE